MISVEELFRDKDEALYAAQGVQNIPELKVVAKSAAETINSMRLQEYGGAYHLFKSLMAMATGLAVRQFQEKTAQKAIASCAWEEEEGVAQARAYRMRSAAAYAFYEELRKTAKEHRLNVAQVMWQKAIFLEVGQGFRDEPEESLARKYLQVFLLKLEDQALNDLKLKVLEDLLVNLSVERMQLAIRWILAFEPEDQENRFFTTPLLRKILGEWCQKVHIVELKKTFGLMTQ